MLADIALLFFEWAYDGFNSLDALSWTTIIIMMIILPIGLFIWSLFTITNIIEITEQGISRIRFGKVIRSFKWEEVETITSTEGGTFAGWIYISNKQKSYNYQHVTKMRLDKDVIYFHQSKKAQQALVKYAPEKFQPQINQYLSD